MFEAVTTIFNRVFSRTNTKPFTPETCATIETPISEAKPELNRHLSDVKTIMEIDVPDDSPREEFKRSQSNVLVVLNEPSQTELEQYIQTPNAKTQFSEFEREKIHRAIDLFEKASVVRTSSLSVVAKNTKNSGYAAKLEQFSDIFSEVFKLKTSTEPKEYHAYLEILKGNVAIGMIDGHFKHYITLKKVFSDTYHQMEAEKEMLKLQTAEERESHALMISNRFGYSPFNIQTLSNRMAASLKNQNDLVSGAYNTTKEVDNSDLMGKEMTFQYEKLHESVETRKAKKMFDPTLTPDIENPHSNSLMDQLDTKLTKDDE